MYPISAASRVLRGVLIILVYPPLRLLYIGAISFTRREAAILGKNFCTFRYAKTTFSPFLARVISRSANFLNSFAFGNVVFIFLFIIKFTAKPFKSAFLWFLTLPNFLPFFWCFIVSIHEVIILIYSKLF